IADFGMSREGPAYVIPRFKRAPIRWLAPETLKSKCYTFKTDVFSFGVMCWEVFHDCKDPYPGMSCAEVSKHVKSGKRMVLEAPLNADFRTVIMNNCWEQAQERRSSQAEVSRLLEAITGQPRTDFDAEARRRREKE
ncbi:hypothetical protein PFISCL1PPCAC_22079, partial [Pristionchus fissidentatus]